MIESNILLFFCEEANQNNNDKSPIFIRLAFPFHEYLPDLSTVTKKKPYS